MKLVDEGVCHVSPFWVVENVGVIRHVPQFEDRLLPKCSTNWQRLRVRVNQRIHFPPNVPLFLLSTGVGMQRGRVGTIQGKVGRIQVLAGLAPPSQTVVCNIRALRKVAPSIFGRKNWREVAENI